MRHTFISEQWLPHPVELAFAFFANPENLPRLMPSWQKARIEEASFAPPPAPPQGSAPASRGIVAGVGTRMTISFRPVPFSPLRVPWDALIDEFAWNDHFCDTQLRGPFAFWHHCHHLRAETRESSGGPVAGCLLRDELEYELPLGALGELAHSLFVKRQVQSIFAYRHKRTEELMAIMAAKA